MVLEGPYPSLTSARLDSPASLLGKECRDRLASQQPIAVIPRHTEDRAPPAVGESYMRLL